MTDTVASGTRPDKGGASGPHTGAPDSGATPQATRPVSLGLRPLTPQYCAGQHGPYVEELVAALEQDNVHNIALTGRYGSGKSSVLEGFYQRLGRKQRRRTAVLSLATLDPESPLPTRESSERTDSEEAPDLSVALTRTNRIQKELVKQLLYRERPQRLPHSRFQRIRNRSRLWSAAVGGTLMAGLALVLWLFDVAPSLVGTGDDAVWWQPMLSYGLFFAIGAVVLGVLHWLAWERYMVRSVSAGGANIELAPRSTSYFDQYLDEIIYFFERTGTDLVIFEDLDRFDDHHIFQSLRDLNVLLNSAARPPGSLARWIPGRRSRPVRFIYATRDSIFDGASVRSPQTQSDPPTTQPSRSVVESRLTQRRDPADRTKFFELIIPIVPFITPASSRGLLIEELNRAGHDGVPHELRVLVAEQITDMRLLRNITNEYTVFHHRLITQDKGVPGLTESALFALVVFKNHHPDEFELATRGTGKLNELYQHAQRCLENDLRVLRRERDRLLERKELPTRTKKLAHDAARALEIHLGGRVPETLERQSVTWRVSVGSKQFTLDDPSLWQHVARAQADVTVTAHDERERPIGRPALQIPIDHLRRITGLALEERSWEATNLEDLADDVRHLEVLIEDTPTLDFETLASRSNRIDPQKSDDEQVSSLNEWMETNLTEFDLVVALIRNGYIGKNFAAFIGENDTSLPATVRTFIYQHVQTNEPFFDYSFAGPQAANRRTHSEGREGEDSAAEVARQRRAAISALLAESDSFLNSPAAYNRELMDHLLEDGQVEQANRVVKRLCTRTEERETDFVRSYLLSGAHAADFVAMLAPHWPNILTTLQELFDTVEVDSKADDVWTAALSNVSPRGEYELNDGFGAWLIERLPRMAILRERSTDDESARVVAILRQAGARLPDLAKVTADGAFRRKAVEAKVYDLTTSNLAVAVGLEQQPDESTGDDAERAATADLSLDRIFPLQPVWEYCRENPMRYLDVLPEGQPSLRSPDRVVDVLGDVVEHWDAECVQRVLAVSAPEATLQALDETIVDPSHWAPLAATNRFLATTDNLDAYLKVEGPEVDQSLAQLLHEQGAVILSEGVDDETKKRLGTVIAHEREVLAPDARADILASLKLEHMWPLATVPADDGALLSPLLKRKLLPDSRETYKHFLDQAGWSAIEPLAAESDDFIQYLDPDFLGTVATADLLSSPGTPEALRAEVISRLDEFLTEKDTDALRVAATTAIKHADTASVASLALISRAIGADDVELVLRLLASQSREGLSSPQLVDMLSHLPEPWSHFKSNQGMTFTAPTDRHSQQMLEELAGRGLAKQDRRRKKSNVTVL